MLVSNEIFFFVLFFVIWKINVDSLNKMPHYSSYHCFDKIVVIVEVSFFQLPISPSICNTRSLNLNFDEGRLQSFSLNHFCNMNFKLNIYIIVERIALH